MTNRSLIFLLMLLPIQAFSNKYSNHIDTSTNPVTIKTRTFEALDTEINKSFSHTKYRGNEFDHAYLERHFSPDGLTNENQILAKSLIHDLKVSQNASILSTGTFTVSATDSRGCQVVGSVFIRATSPTYCCFTLLI